MTQHALHSTVLDRPLAEVWALVRDFDSYPVWVDGVSDSHIEDGLSGTAVGAVRDFGFAGSRQRQRLVAHSDVEHCFSYEGLGEFALEGHAIGWYRGTLRLRPVGVGERCLAEWSADYDCAEADAAYWAAWWGQALPAWLGSLERHLVPTA